MPLTIKTQRMNESQNFEQIIIPKHIGPMKIFVMHFLWPKNF